MSQLPAKSLLDVMKPEDRERVKKREEILGDLQERKVNREWLGIAELGFYYGWSAVKDLIDDVITLEQADMLVESARKLHSGHVLDYAMASLAGNSSKKGSFEKIMKPYIKDMKV